MSLNHKEGMEQKQYCNKFSGESVQFSSVARLYPTLCDPMNCSTPGLPVHHQLPEFTQTHLHRVSDAIQLSHPLSSPSPPAPNPSQHQSLFQWVNSSHEVAKWSNQKNFKKKKNRYRNIHWWYDANNWWGLMWSHLQVLFHRSQHI